MLTVLKQYHCASYLLVLTLLFIHVFTYLLANLSCIHLCESLDITTPRYTEQIQFHLSVRYRRVRLYQYEHLAGNYNLTTSPGS